MQVLRLRYAALRMTTRRDKDDGIWVDTGLE